MYPDRCPPILHRGSGSFVVIDTIDYDVEGVENEPNIEAEECKPRDVNLFNLGVVARDRLIVRPRAAPIKGELVDTNSNFIQKRKQLSDEPQLTIDHKIYTCEYPHCPYNDYLLGFLDRTSRNNHQLICPYQCNSSQPCSMSNFKIDNDISAVFSPPFAQPKPPPPPVNHTPPPFNISGLTLPEDGKKMISELISCYDDTSLNQNKNLNFVNFNGAEYQNQQQPKLQLQQEDNFCGQGVLIGGNISEETNMTITHSAFPLAEIQYGPCKAFDSHFDSIPNGNTADFRFGSPLNFTSDNYSVDPMPKQDVRMWYLRRNRQNLHL